MGHDRKYVEFELDENRKNYITTVFEVVNFRKPIWSKVTNWIAKYMALKN